MCCWASPSPCDIKSERAGWMQFSQSGLHLPSLQLRPYSGHVPRSSLDDSSKGVASFAPPPTSRPRSMSLHSFITWWKTRGLREEHIYVCLKGSPCEPPDKQAYKQLHRETQGQVLYISKPRCSCRSGLKDLLPPGRLQKKTNKQYNLMICKSANI